MSSEFIIIFLKWYIAVSIIGWISFPIGFWFFRNLPGRGAILSKPIGLILINFLLWILVSFGFINNNVVGIFITIFIVGIVSFLFIRRSGSDEIMGFIRKKWKLIVSVELLFFLFFLGWTIFQSYSPNILGTEKPMEFMFLNSILNSKSFPPHDAWLSDYSISYYYFGYLIIATISQLTNTLSSVSFNLGISLVFALTGTASIGVSYNLILILFNGFGNQSLKRITSSKALVFSLFTPIVILLVGNFYGVLGIINNNGGLANFTFPSIWYNYANEEVIGKSNVDSINTKPGIVFGEINFWDWLDIKQLNRPLQATSNESIDWGLPNWFFASRVIHDRDLMGNETEVIDEFPTFSFLLGDLHPHLLSLPFNLLAIALSIEWMIYASKNEEYLKTQSIFEWLSWRRILLTSILLGSIIFLNTWDFPVYFFIFGVLLLIGIGLSGGWRSIVDHFWKIIKILGLIVFSCLTLFFLFIISLQTQANGINLNLFYPTKFHQLFIMFGPLIIGAGLFIGFLIKHFWKDIDKRFLLIVCAAVFFIFNSFLIFSISFKTITNEFSQSINSLSQDEGLKLLLQKRLLDVFSAILPIGMIAISAGIIKKWIKHDNSIVLEKSNGTPPKESILDSEKPAILILLVLLITGSLLVLAPEYIYLGDNFGTRMNTVFKFYYQVWVLWGIVFSVSAFYILNKMKKLGKIIFIIIYFVSISFGLIYTISSMKSITNNFSSNPTLDGMKYFIQSYPNDWNAIQWLEENANESDIILEGTRGAYWIEGPSSRISMATGLQTVIGWVNHESQWRGSSFQNLYIREQEIRTIYESRVWTEVIEIIKKYRIVYIIVGQFEVDIYPRLSIHKFDNNTLKVFESGNVTIYKVFDTLD